MAKKKEGWKTGEGAYSNSDDLNLRRKPMVGSGNAPGDVKDRTRTVDANSERSDGYAAALTPSKE